MTSKYKLETWKKTSWKGTRRETAITIQMLVKRDLNGRFSKNNPVIKEIRQKTYGSGTYQIGVYKNKIITRHKIAPRNIQWQKEKEEKFRTSIMYRCSLALNDIPYKGDEYYGFRIIAFSRRKQILESVYPKKMEYKLIEFIEKCLKYRSDEFWFGHYLNYMGKIAPEIANASISENNKYYLLWTKRKTGTILKQDYGHLGDL